MFEVGQEVNLVLNIIGIVTEERGVVLEINKRGVWLDNGPGNDPSGPYDPETGQWADNDIIAMSRQRIIALEELEDADK